MADEVKFAINRNDTKAIDPKTGLIELRLLRWIEQMTDKINDLEARIVVLEP